MDRKIAKSTTPSDGEVLDLPKHLILIYIIKRAAQIRRTWTVGHFVIRLGAILGSKP